MIGGLFEAREMPPGCTKCALAATRRHIVISRGMPRAPVLFVGEAPGADEDAAGRPFVGRSGKLLDRWIEAMGLGVEEYQISNVVRCRPPGNRVPSVAEMYECGRHLLWLIRAEQPHIVIALGRTADNYLASAGVQHVYQRHPSWYMRGNHARWPADIELLRKAIRAVVPAPP